MLERTRAECDDCYCQDCYVDMHANGKRALHRWVGFLEYAHVSGLVMLVFKRMRVCVCMCLWFEKNFP